MARICIVGTGYVGLCTGLVFSEHGHEVTFVDVDPNKLAAVEQGRAPFYEPGVDELIRKQRPRLRTSTDLAKAVEENQFTFLCVGTPQGKDGAIDLTYVRNAAREIGRALKSAPRGHVVVVKSTVVPGTAEDVVLKEVQQASGLAPDEDFHVASNPEFLKEGSAMKDALHPDRVVVGARTPRAAEAVLALYGAFSCPKLSVDPRTAEMIKYAANAFLATKIAFSNEMANVSERLGVDWYQIAEGIGHDARIGPLFLRAGVGYGGSCFPKDVAAIQHLADAAGAPSPILDAVLRNNDTQPLVAVRMLEEELGSLRGKRVALLGLAFKADTDDVRETRALPIWRALRERGADVVCHDPKGGPNFQRVAPEAKVVSTVEDALKGADAALVQTEWKEYRDLQPDVFTKMLKAPAVVVDGRRTFDPRRMLDAGIRYRAVGLGRQSEGSGKSPNFGMFRGRLPNSGDFYEVL